MKILFVKTKDNHQKTPMESMSYGFKRHNISTNFASNFNPTIDKADVIFVWAWRPYRPNGHWKRIQDTQISRGKHFVVMERGYIGDRFLWTSMGFGGLNGNADFCNKDISDQSRFNKFFESDLKEWKSNSTGKVLVVGQCKNDASVSHVNIELWYHNTIKELNAKGKEIIFRPHPLEPYKWSNRELKYSLDKNKRLEDTLGMVDSVVTFSSNSGVLSTLYGLPTISYDKGSMVYDVTKHDQEDLDYRPDRTDWSAKMAYTQWNLNELESGDAWEHLKGGIKL